MQRLLNSRCRLVVRIAELHSVDTGSIPVIDNLFDLTSEPLEVFNKGCLLEKIQNVPRSLPSAKA